MDLPSKLRAESFGSLTLFAPAQDKISFKQRFSTVWHIDKCMPRLKGRRTVVQAGGNLGQWPLYLSERFDSVWTFEPSRINFQCLCLNTAGRDNIVRIPFGLGSSSGLVAINEDVANCEGTYLLNAAGSIPVVSLDAVFPEGAKLDLLLLDLEGMEMAAIEGAAKTIQRNKPLILLEYREFDRETYSAEVMRDYLGGLGYTLVDTASKDLIYEYRG